jgi:quercetin dioxygenase-like cupin family protein
VGEIERTELNPGDTWTVPYGRKHRLVALDDIVILEASTPEVDDVVRVVDDTNRLDGRVESEHACGEGRE